MLEVQNKFPGCNQIVSRVVSSGGSREEPLPHHSHLPEVANIPWLGAASLHSLFPTSHSLLHSLPVTIPDVS